MIRAILLTCALVSGAAAADDRLALPGKQGPGKGKRVVLVSGDEEYRSEQAMPQLAKILAERHGFDCTVLFAIDPKDGTINPNVQSNIPGLETLANADLMILMTRFRDLPDAQMKHIVDYVDSGRPIVALRTATHAFDIKTSPTYKKWGWNNKDKEWEGGFGRQILGETWIAHHGRHAVESTRGIFAAGQEGHPILRGIKSGEIWGPTDVYRVRLPLPADTQTLVLGAVLTGMNESDPPLEGAKNDPMMPVAWTRQQTRRVFTTTMGSAQDLLNGPFRRMVVNSVYWALKLENRIDPKSNVDIVGDYKPLPFKFNGHQPGVKVSDLAGR
jgi:type 1 glutamine amidotransferase